MECFTRATLYTYSKKNIRINLFTMGKQNSLNESQRG